MADIKFPDGISVFAKNANAPEYVGDSIVIDKQKLAAWLLLQPEKIKLQIMLAKSGKKYLKVDDWQPSGQQPAQAAPAITATITTDNNDLPF